MSQYVHGYSPREAERLRDQACTVRDLLHHDTAYPPGSRVLEAGCGVGAQTVTLARNSPGAQITSIDISPASLAQAAALIEREGLSNVTFRVADLFNLEFPAANFDHVFVCYVLEHLADPAAALARLARGLKKGGSITVIEGDHGSYYFHPETPAALKTWRCMIEVQARLGGDSLIGRRLYPLLEEAGFTQIHVSPRVVYADPGKPELMDGFVRKTITPMTEGVREQALAMGLIDEATWSEGIRDLYAIADREDGTACYTFFKAVATLP